MWTHRGSGGDGGDSADNALALKGYRRALATPSAPARTVKRSSATPMRLSCDRGVASTKWLHTSLGLPAITDHARSPLGGPRAEHRSGRAEFKSLIGKTDLVFVVEREGLEPSTPAL